MAETTTTRTTPPRAVTRRGFVTGTLALGGVGVLAACATDGGSDTPTTTPGGGQGSPGDQGGTGGAVGGVLVALADVPVGGAVAVTAGDGAPLLVARPAEDEAVAFSAVCTHMGCTVEPDPEATGRLECPCHGSVYRTTTGENVAGPAPRPLEPVPVEVRDGEVVPR